MSWFFVKISKNNIENNIINLPELIEEFIIDNVSFSYGGNKNNLIIKKNEKRIIFISGFIFENDLKLLIDIDEINDIIKLNINGHFAILIYEDNKIYLFTDKLGLREIYLYENKEYIYISTRLDLLFKIDKFEINFYELSSKWNLINQISNNSIIKNIIKINCGTDIKIFNNKIEINKNNWLPRKSNNIEMNYLDEKIKYYFNQIEDKNITLCLSGGIDSRLLLSYFFNKENLNVYIFKTESKADFEISTSIAKKLKLNYKILNYQDIKVDELINNSFEYISQTYLTECVSLATNLIYYKYLPKNNITIDGGFGEIWRREFLIKLQLFGRDDIKYKNLKNIINYLIKPRANLFNEEVNKIMEKGMYDQIEEVVNFLPNIEEIGIDNWVDLFALKTRLNNYYGPEQSRIDNYVSGFMPFAQIDLIENIINLPIQSRKNNIIFKKLINNNNKDLTKYHLAKGNFKYPFWFNSIAKKIYLNSYSKIFNKINYHEVDSFLFNFKEFTMDSINSNSFKNYTPYNRKLISKKINEYYEGKKEYRDFVDWFITFEIFRKIINKEN